MKLIATDMDGTFLDDTGQFDGKRLRRVLDSFKQKGWLFVVASGRSMLALEKIFADYLEDMAVIAENGTLVKIGEKVIYEASMSRDQYLEIAETLIASPYMRDYRFLLSGENGAYLHPKASEAYQTYISQYYEGVQRVPDLSQVTDTILKLTANFTEETVRQGEEWFNRKISYARAVTTGFRSIDIILSDVNKRTGLEALCRTYGISQSDVVAFGDNLNDFEMLTFAGTAIATSNARDEIKAIADDVIGHCREQSVMTYIEEMIINDRY